MNAVGRTTYIRLHIEIAFIVGSQIDNLTQPGVAVRASGAYSCTCLRLIPNLFGGLGCLWECQIGQIQGGDLDREATIYTNDERIISPPDDVGNNCVFDRIADRTVRRVPNIDYGNAVAAIRRQGQRKKLPIGR